VVRAPGLFLVISDPIMQCHPRRKIARPFDMDIPTPTLYDALCRLLSPASSFLRDVEKLDRQDDHAVTRMFYPALRSVRWTLLVMQLSHNVAEMSRTADYQPTCRHCAAIPGHEGYNSESCLTGHNKINHSSVTQSPARSLAGSV
jgi:hypothetical protein